MAEPKYDAVHRPAHYAEGRTIEPIDVIEDWGMGFCDGNALKYLSRLGRKEGNKKLREDADKAIWYINRFVAEQQRKIIAKGGDVNAIPGQRN